MTATESARGYHHGDLRRALLLTGVELARASGPEAVTLREASRRLGVSHNAAYRHYADREALLEAVASYGFEGLATSMRAELRKVPDGTPAQTAMARMLAVGRGYVRYSTRNPGLYRTMFAAKGSPPPASSGSVDHTANADHTVNADAALDAFGILNATLDGLVEAGVMPPANRRNAEFAAWSSVHGLSDMFLDGPLCGLPKRDRQPIIDRTLLMVASGLVASGLVANGPVGG